MNIYTRLKKDHDKQRELCENIKSTYSGSQNRADLWEELKIELEAHAAAEEQVFYSALMQKPDGTKEARHSVHEHQEMTKIIKELDAMDQSTDIWEKKFEKLAHEVMHHVDEEEADIFPVARKVIDSERAKEMVEDFNTRKPAEAEKQSA
ncbi:MAG: hemerythrin domain-containing protein [Hellea sp.]|nr:hemerythrin domain-containing protein [Hellea sp.]